MIKGFNAIATLFDSKTTTTKENKTKKYTFLRNYHTVYNLTQNSELLTTAVPEKVCQGSNTYLVVVYVELFFLAKQ